MAEFLTLNTENFSTMQEQLESQLEQFKIEQKDILRAELLVEEIFWRMSNLGKFEQVMVEITKRIFGGVQIVITAEGASYNPLVEISDWDEDDEEYYRTLILKANRQKMSWLHKNNRNVITINVGSEKNLQLKLTLAGMVGGLIFGLIAREIFSPEILKLLNDDLITPLNTMFMHALGMVIAPVIFFSIVAGITGMGAGAGVGKVGSKLIALYLGTSLISAGIGLVASKIFFGGDVPKVGTIASDIDTSAANTYNFSLIQFIVDIIPSNMISPVVDGNLLQVIFVAVICAIALNSLGDKVKSVRDFMAGCNELFLKIVGMITFFVPLIAFFAMMEMASSTDFTMIAMAGRLIAAEVSGLLVTLVMYAIMIAFVGKISPLPFCRKIPSLWPVPFATSSSAVTMPFTMKFCTEKLGIAEKISSFSIPIGTTINMNGCCVYFSLAAIMFIKMYGVELDANALMVIFTMTVSLSVGAPAVPNASVICILTITSTFGVPQDIVGLLFCIAAIGDRTCTVFNVTGDVAASLTLARTENLLDEKVFFRN